MLKKIKYLIFAVFSLFILFWLLQKTGGISEALRQIRQFSVSALLLLLLINLMNLWITSVRLWRVLRYFSISIPLMSSVRATVAGGFSSLFFIPLISQIAGRQFYLQKAGVPSGINAGLAAYERAVLFIVGLALAALGGVVLFGRAYVFDLISSVPYFQIFLILFVTIILLFISEEKIRKKFLDSISLNFIKNSFEFIFLSFVSRILMIFCFFFVFSKVAPEVDTLQLLSISAIVSFLASIPIGVGGWGIREVSSVYFLGLFSVESSTALAASIVVGLVSTASILIALPVLKEKKIDAKSFSNIQRDSKKQTNVMDGLTKTITGLIGFVAVFFIFFHIYLDLSRLGSPLFLNINFADPLALICLSVLLLEFLFLKTLPEWRYEKVTLWLMMFLVVLLLSAFLGYLKEGVISWALSGKLMGYSILLGYLSAGFLIVHYFNNYGLKLAFKILGIVSCWVVLLKLVLLEFGLDHSGSFAGFSVNRNAFAFTLLIILSVFFGGGQLYEKSKKRILFYLLLGVIGLGTFMTGSRTAYGLLVILPIVSLSLRLIRMKTVVTSFLIASALFLSFYLSLNIQGKSFYFPNNIVADGRFVTQGSDSVRWKSDLEALKMWIDSPVFGQGLGVFYKNSSARYGEPLVIHNTALWLLAELGLVGFLSILGPVFLIFIQAFKRIRFSIRDRSLFLVLLTFFLFSQVHEVLYQRILWLVLGLLLGVGKMVESQDRLS